MGTLSVFFFLLLPLLLVVVPSDAQLPGACSGGSCYVYACGNHLAKYGYRPVTTSTCCTAPTNAVLDRNCCRLKTQNYACYCWPNSTCYRRENPPTTPPTTFRVTTPTTTLVTTPATTQAATTQATTPARASLCKLTPNLRLLNGLAVQKKCAHKGIATVKFYGKDAENLTDTSITCHATLAELNINGTMETAFETSKTCLNYIKSAADYDLGVALSIGDILLPVGPCLFDMKEGTGERAYLKLLKAFQFMMDDLEPCQSEACAYDSGKMGSVIYFKDCVVDSYGASDADYNENGLYEAECEYSPNDCGTTTNFCFKAKSGLSTICQHDEAAPVYCKHPLNDEDIFMGMVKEKSCTDDSPAFEVIPAS